MMKLSRRGFLIGSAAAVVAGSMPAAAMRVLPPPTPPLIELMFPGTFLCNGAELSRKEYPLLFALIGERYGARSSETFTLPDLRGRVSMAYTGTPAALPEIVQAIVAKPNEKGMFMGVGCMFHVATTRRSLGA